MLLPSDYRRSAHQIDYFGGQDRQLWFYLERRLHVRMEAAVIIDRTGVLQHKRGGLIRRECHVEVAVACGCGMGDDVLVGPFDGVADLGRDLGRRDIEILHDDLDRRRVSRHGHRTTGNQSSNQAKAPGLHVSLLTSHWPRFALHAARDPEKSSSRFAEGSSAPRYWPTESTASQARCRQPCGRRPRWRYKPCRTPRHSACRVRPAYQRPAWTTPCWCRCLPASR